MTKKQFEILSYLALGLVAVLLLAMWLNWVPVWTFPYILYFSLGLMGLRIFLRMYFKKHGFREE